LSALQKFTLENPRKELKVVSIEPFWFPELYYDSSTNIKFHKEEDLSEVWDTPKKINHHKEEDLSEVWDTQKKINHHKEEDLSVCWD
jgi:hypothetical protein